MQRVLRNVKTHVRGFSSFAQIPTVENHQKTSLMFTINDSPGALQKALNVFSSNNVSLSRIESKPCVNSPEFEFNVVFGGDSSSPSIQSMLSELKSVTTQVNITEGATVPWFPRTKADIDIIASEILDAGAELEADHPGFHDPVYRARRDELTQAAINYRHGDKIPHVEYTPEEIKCWGTVYTHLRELHMKHACEEQVKLLELFEQNCGYGPDVIPQIDNINKYLQSCTGFSVRPVAGLVSARGFLSALAFRVFLSTQYLRHHSSPLYTPEPDLVHETMGHMVLFSNPDFAAFSQLVGLCAIGASDEDIEKLARCYWFTVEFGLCKQNGELKAYGAGLLSSTGELQYAVGLDEKKPEYKPFTTEAASLQTYPITEYQPLYFVAEDFKTMQTQMLDFMRTIKKPFNVRYDPITQTIDVDANVNAAKHQFEKPDNVYAQ